MLKKDLIQRNPLRLMGHDADDILQSGQLGAVLARAGVGKTAFLVQLALNKMLRGKNVLHVSLEDPVRKVGLWYAEVWRNATRDSDTTEAGRLWEEVVRHRFIMTFRVEGFRVATLAERLEDLTEQGIFTPEMMIVDGLPLQERTAGPILDELRQLAAERGLHVWLAMLTHRHEMPAGGGMPPLAERFNELLTAAVLLRPADQTVEVVPLKGAAGGPPRVFLDATTMLLRPSR